MKTVVPNYYKHFSCIASACRHSCCVGWEIDIDPDTLYRYSTFEGDLGKKLKKNISDEGGTPHFVLDEKERCPFLNESGLCEIIIGCGEECLCDICADHPRFRNYFSDRTEIGLGLCCEAAADLIINYNEPFELVTDEDDGFDDELAEEEKELIEKRDFALKIATDSSLDFKKKTEKLTEYFGIKEDRTAPAEWAKRLKALERLDPQWDDCIEIIAEKNELISLPEDEKAAGNLLCYFIYRHLSAACDSDDARSRIAFALFSCKIIFTLSAHMPAKEAARMYSSEIEYSDENLDMILSQLHN